MWQQNSTAAYLSELLRHAFLTLLVLLGVTEPYPNYTGPYNVGTLDAEVPIRELVSPGPAPTGSSGIRTVQFRIFYPAKFGSRTAKVGWLPEPRRR